MIAQNFRFTISDDEASLLFTANIKDGKVFVSWDSKKKEEPVEYRMIDATRNINEGAWIVHSTL